MKVTFNDEDLFTLSETQKKVIKNDILEEEFEFDMRRRLKYWIENPCEKVCNRKKEEWRKDLKANGASEYPVNEFELYDKYSKKLQRSDLEADHVIKVDNQELFRVKPTLRKMITQYLCNSDVEFCKNQLKFILQHKYERCMARLRHEWEQRLAKKGMKSFPLDNDQFAELVFSQPEYKNRSQRDSEAKQKGLI